VIRQAAASAGPTSSGRAQAKPEPVQQMHCSRTRRADADTQLTGKLSVAAGHKSGTLFVMRAKLISERRRRRNERSSADRPAEKLAPAGAGASKTFIFRGAFFRIHALILSVLVARRSRP
jgi:hypothetical protein